MVESPPKINIIPPEPSSPIVMKHTRFALQTKSRLPSPAAVRHVTHPPVPTAAATAIATPQQQPMLPKLSDTQSKYHNVIDKEPPKYFVGHMFPRKGALFHQAAEELLQYATRGCPVDCGPDWTIEQHKAAIQMGPCQSATSIEAITACRTEILAKVKEGHCRLIKWSDIEHNPPKNLKISPIAAIPHKTRQFRMILNLAYNLVINKQKLKSVNDTTDKTLAPQHSMYELGNVIPRIIWAMARAPDTGVPILFSKIDLKDGYWRMVVNEDDAWNFAYVLPTLNNTDEIQLVIPNALQMGWSESPAFFCAATETARDLADSYYSEDKHMTPHEDEKTIMKIDWSKIPTSVREDKDANILFLLESYIDDFIALIQTTDETELRRLTRSILHAITEVFPGENITHSAMGSAISKKKLEQEGAWETRKEILGWVLDGIARTIQLPKDKCDKLIKLLRGINDSRSIQVKALQSIQGKLQFTSIAVPLGKPLLGAVDKIIATAEQKQQKRVPVDDVLKQYEQTWRTLLYLLRSRPTHVRELILHKDPTYRGLVDASGWGVGGVWFGGSRKLTPFVWYCKWPENVSAQLCTNANKSGTITISDLELLGIFMHWLALEDAVGTKNLSHSSPAIWCDNMPAVTWVHKFRSNVSSIAANILRAFATRLHCCHSGLLAVDHISGIFNILADTASRKHSTNNKRFLHAFNTLYPPPQNNSWTLYVQSKKTTWRIYSELLLQTSKMGSFRRLRKNESAFLAIGEDGSLSTIMTYQQTCKNSAEPNRSTSWLPTDAMLETAAFHLANTKLVLKRSRWHFEPSPRSVNWTQNLIPWQLRKEAIRKRLVCFWKDTDGKTHPHNQG